MKNVPKLRFKGFNDEWEKKKLGSLGEFFKGNGISKADLTDEGQECILYGELYTKYNEVIEKIHSKTNADLSNKILSKSNDIIIPSSGETAIDIATASCVKKDNVLLGGDLNVFRPKTSNGVFISYQLNNTRKSEIAKLAQGASVVHVYNDQLRKININIPNIEEQEKIANFLTKVDKLIEKQDEKVNSLEQYKKGMMQKIFSQEIRFKKDDGGECPEWENDNLGNVCSIIMGQSPNSEFYNESFKGLPLIQGNADMKGRKTLPRMYTTSITKICEVGDIIMSVRAPAGTIAISDHEACIGRGVCAIKTKLVSGFIYQLLLIQEDKWDKFSQGSTFDSINSSDINDLKISVPCLVEQTKIAKFLSNIDKIIEKEKEKLEGLRQWKKGLLQDMFV